MQAWVDERGADRKLTVISGEHFLVDDNDKQDFAAMVEMLEDGAEPSSVLSEKADCIPLAAIHRVEHEAGDTALTVHYREGKDRKSEIYFYSTPEVRDEIAGGLHEALGDAFQSHTDVYNLPRAIYAPLLTIVLTVLASWILSGAARTIQAAEEVEISGKNGLLKRLVVWALDLLGPTGVMILAWLVVILALRSFYRRALQPPVMTIIQAEPFKGGTVAGTAVKYALLAGLVFITARAVIS